MFVVINLSICLGPNTTTSHTTTSDNSDTFSELEKKAR